MDFSGFFQFRFRTIVRELRSGARLSLRADTTD
jgi:hypothetical protein